MSENPNLVECPDCNNEVSRKAVACPHCGSPLSGEPAKKGQGIPWKLIVGVGASILILVGLFLPFVSVPTMGISMIKIGEGIDAMIIGALTLLCILLTFLKRNAIVIILGIIIACILGWDTYQVFERTSGHGVYSQMVQPGIGMIMLWLSTIALIISGFIKK